MEVFVDNHRVDQEMAMTGTLEETVRHLQQGFCKPGRMVVGLRCDGKEIIANEMAATLNQPTASWEKLEVFTGTPGSLVGDAMGQASGMLAQSEELYQAAAQGLAEGNTQAGIESLAACITIWQQVHEAVGKSIQMLTVDPDAIMINDITLTEAVGKPRDVLMQIKGALQAGDHVLLADILNYEMQETTELWHAVVTTLHSEGERQDKGKTDAD
ncbi:MAG: hypothetical protein ACYTHJ_17735 [Planctomycetota bacterium]